MVERKGVPAAPAGESAKARFERLVVERGESQYVLRLFVTGMSPQSTEAVATVKGLCEDLLAGRYELEVVDLYQNPTRARDDQVIAAPTLVKEQPLPVRRLIGDLSNRQRVSDGLNLAPEKP